MKIGDKISLPPRTRWHTRITAKDVYDGLAEQLEGSNHYFGTELDVGDLTNVTIDGQIDCAKLAEFLNSRPAR